MDDSDADPHGIAAAAGAAARHFATIRNQPVTGPAHIGDLRPHLARRFDFETPWAPDDAVKHVAAMLARGSVHVTHPRYFGLFNPSVIPSAIAGATLAAAFNPQTAAWTHSEAEYAIEDHVLRWLAARIGYDPAAISAHFCSGGQEANTTAVLVALTAACPEIREHGVRALRSDPVLYVSHEAHHSFEKAAHVCGIGRAAVRRIAVDANLRMDVAALDAAIRADRAAGRIPFLVAGTAGTTSAGVIDPLAAIADVCAAHGVWFHADAAWGGGALLSPRLRPHLAGIERADSVIWDAHKWLSAPLGTGMYFTRHRDAPRAAFATDSAYMPAARGGITDPMNVSHQWSRRPAGLPLFLALATTGREGYERMIDHMAEMGDLLKSKLTAAGFRVVSDTPFPLATFTHPRIESGDLTPGDVARAVTKSGKAWISPTVLAQGTPREMRVLRACITSFRTEEQDLDVLLAALGDALKNGGRSDD